MSRTRTSRVSARIMGNCLPTPALFADNLAVHVDRTAAHYGSHRLSFELAASIWAPSSQTQHVLVFDLVFLFEIDQHEIGKIPRHDIALLLNAKNARWRSRSGLDNALEFDFAFKGCGQEHADIELGRRRAGVCLPAVLPADFLFLAGVRCVI